MRPPKVYQEEAALSWKRSEKLEIKNSGARRVPRGAGVLTRVEGSRHLVLTTPEIQLRHSTPPCQDKDTPRVRPTLVVFTKLKHKPHGWEVEVSWERLDKQFFLDSQIWNQTSQVPANQPVVELPTGTRINSLQKNGIQSLHNMLCSISSVQLENTSDAKKEEKVIHSQEK